jgi:hypothetical protein
MQIEKDQHLFTLIFSHTLVWVKMTRVATDRPTRLKLPRPAAECGSTGGSARRLSSQLWAVRKFYVLQLSMFQFTTIKSLKWGERNKKKEPAGETRL